MYINTQKTLRRNLLQNPKFFSHYFDPDYPASSRSKLRHFYDIRAIKRHIVSNKAAIGQCIVIFNYFYQQITIQIR